MKSLRLLLLGFFLTTAGAAFGQSVLDKVKDGVSKAVDATKNGVRTAADKVGTAVENTADKVKEAVKPADKEKTVTETTGTTTVTTTTITTPPGPIVGVADPAAILPKIEKEIGRPLTPDERDKYLLDLENAKAKARAAENDLAAQISQITGVPPDKSEQIVRGNGL